MSKARRVACDESELIFHGLDNKRWWISKLQAMLYLEGYRWCRNRSWLGTVLKTGYGGYVPVKRRCQ